ncbi:MAG: AAA family ATPase [Candidatus Symbiothrix sp.]|jgi:predicted AAA+ superfamily ATPase|nr:AAA family ATPase [Candidatus Symbiothrix sp.]
MNYLSRNIDADLLAWKDDAGRKPLLLRGARQVGKSSSVRNLGKTFEFFLEINFENKDFTAAKGVFERHSNSKTICDELSALYETPIAAGKTLLFLDEIQSCVEAISALRYFYEQMPDLHVIAAGSLLEFAMEKIPSYAVGRVRSLYMYPFTFEEFLSAMGKHVLLERLRAASPETPLSDELHSKLKELFLRFIVIGGMPEAVAKYAAGGSLLDCQHILDDLIETFINDFAKYKIRVPATRLEEVFAAVIAQTGQKFTYSDVETSANQPQLKESIELLRMAGLVYIATHSSANGFPLGAETNPRYRKMMIFDTGLYQRFLRLNLSNLLLEDKMEQINKGALAEMSVGIELVKAQNNRLSAELYYWQREKQDSNAEVDYVVQIGENIVPIEVKSGTKGAMQSMFIFLKEKNKPFGIRCSMENFGQFQNIKIYPLYAVKQAYKSTLVNHS